MKKYQIVHKGYFFGGLLGIGLGLINIYSNYKNKGACTYFKRGGAGSSLCGNDNYILAALILIISFIAISGGIKKKNV